MERTKQSDKDSDTEMFIQRNQHDSLSTRTSNCPAAESEKLTCIMTDKVLLHPNLNDCCTRQKRTPGAWITSTVTINHKMASMTFHGFYSGLLLFGQCSTNLHWSAMMKMTTCFSWSTPHDSSISRTRIVTSLKIQVINPIARMLVTSWWHKIDKMTAENGTRNEVWSWNHSRVCHSFVDVGCP